MTEIEKAIQEMDNIDLKSDNAVDILHKPLLWRKVGSLGFMWCHTCAGYHDNCESLYAFIEISNKIRTGEICWFTVIA